MTLITSKEFAKATNIDKLRMPGLASLLMEIMKINDVNELVARAEHLQGIAFVDKVLQILGIKIEINEKDLKNIPKEGAFIAVSNHPYGGIEGLILLKLLNSVRPESKLMANFILNKVPSLNKFLVPVNPFENIDHSSSISGLKTTLSLLSNGTPIGIFPAGEVSTYKLDQQKVTDKLWHPVVGKIISKAKVTVLPVYFHGNNGLLFNLLSLIHPTLRTAKLASELFNKNGDTIKVRIGKPIQFADIHNNTNTTSVLSYLRAKTYALGAGLENEKKIFNPRSLFKIRKQADTVINSIEKNLLAHEVENLRTQHLVWTEKNYEVFISPTALIPNIIREIGRLREITFREVKHNLF
jgi:putative hemolysin